MPKKRATTRAARKKCLTIKEILNGYERAREIFDKLVSDKVDQKALADLLCAIPNSPDEKLALVPGMEDRTLRRLPGQMHHWADKLAAINRSSSLDPRMLPSTAKIISRPDLLPKPLDVRLTQEASQLFARKFQSLPGLLHLYADYLGVWVPRLKMGSRHGFRPRTFLTLKLLKLVKDSTGRNHYGEIATLLTEAYKAAELDLDVDAEDLRKLNKNNPMLRILLHPELIHPSLRPAKTRYG